MYYKNSNFMEIVKNGGLITVISGKNSYLIPQERFVPILKDNNSQLEVRNGEILIAGDATESTTVNGTALTPDSAADELGGLVSSEGSGGGGLTEAQVRQIIQDYDYVPWTESEPGRKHILLENDWSILGKDTAGTSHNLIMLSKYDVCDISSATIPKANVNTPKGERLTDQEAGETGAQAHRYAYETDIPELAGKVYAYFLPSLPNTATFNLATKFRFRIQKQNRGFSVILALWDPSTDEETIWYSDGVNYKSLLVTSAGSVVINETVNNNIVYDFVITSQEYSWNVHIGISDGLTTMSCLIVEHTTTIIT